MHTLQKQWQMRHVMMPSLAICSFCSLCSLCCRHHVLPLLCFSLLCFLPVHSGHQWTYQPGSHRRKVTQDFSSTFFLRCVPLFFSREEFSHSFPSSTVKVEFCVLTTIYSFSTRWAFLFLFFSFLVRKIPSAGVELTSQRVRGLRGTSELPGRPAPLLFLLKLLYYSH